MVVKLQPPVEPEPSDLEPRLRRRLLVLIGCCGTLVHGLLWWLYYHPVTKPLWGDERWYHEAARQVLAGDSSWREAGLWPPLYPHFEAWIMAVTGTEVLGIQVVQSLLLIVLAWVLGDLTRRITGSDVAALAAAGLTVAYPPLAAYSHYMWPEVVHLVLFMAALWALVVPRPSFGWGAIAGVSLGLCLLAKSLLTPFLPVLLVAVAWRREPDQPVVSRKGLLMAAVVALAMACTVGPAMVAQHRRSGSPVLSDSSSFNLWVGLSDRSRKNHVDPVVHDAKREFEASGTTLEYRNRHARRQIRAHFEEHSLPAVLADQLGKQYFRLFDKDSFLSDQLWGGPALDQDRGYVNADPRVSMALRDSSRAIYALVLALAPMGWFLWRCRRQRWMRVLLLFLLYNLAVFFWLHVKTRYRVQMLPIFFIGCGCALDWLRLRLGGHELPRAPVAAWIAAVVLAVLFELFAFGGSWL